MAIIKILPAVALVAITALTYSAKGDPKGDAGGQPQVQGQDGREGGGLVWSCKQEIANPNAREPPEQAPRLFRECIRKSLPGNNTPAGPAGGDRNPAPSADTAAGDPDRPVACRIDVEGSRFDPSIAAFAKAAGQPKSGTFALEIVKDGENSVRSRQSGSFALAPDEAQRLAVIRLHVDARDVLEGRLSLNWKGGESVCMLDWR